MIPAKKLPSILLVLLFWLLVVTLLRWSWQFDLIFLWLGAFLGIYLFDLDHLLYSLWFAPQELTSLRVRSLLKQRQFRQVIALLSSTQAERQRLMFHSVVFQAALLIVSFFVLTSSGSLLGGGVVMGLFLHLLWDQFQDFRDQNHINRWFWQIEGQVPQRLQAFFFLAGFIVFFLFSLFLL